MPDDNPESRLIAWPRRALDGLLHHWRAIEREGLEERVLLKGRFDGRPLGVLILVALVLVGEEYGGDRPTFAALFPAVRSEWYQLAELAWWSGAKVVGYLLIPALVAKAVGWRLGELGLSWRGLGRHLWIYGVLYLAILPALIIASRTRPFLATYPFYHLASRSRFDLLAWEAMYGATFVSLEFFFRGFMLFSLRRTLGPHAIFVMAVPYCMIHFHKPLAEVIGAIFAGILLGTLALRTRSIWGGVLLHVAVAWTMDLLALSQR